MGEDRISYYGTSYGTFLGATYANMFPERLRAMVLDGAVTPSAWSGGTAEDMALSTFIRIGSDFGAEQGLRAFMDQCGAVDAGACAFSAGSPEATRRKWDDLLERAKAGISIDGQTINDADLRSYVGALTYTVAPVPGFDRFPGWPAVATFLEQAAAAPPATVSAHPADAEPQSAAAPAPYVTSAGRQLSVVCGESPNPATEASFLSQVDASYARAGLSAWPFVAACMGWTARAAAPYLGPWNTPTPVPILVVGNTYDPATPLASSVRMAQELADGHLLVVNGFGHTVLINPSRCAQDYIAMYLMDGRLPPAGASCNQDRPPFPGD